MKIVHLQLMGGPGGIVSLCRSIMNHSKNEHYLYFLFSGGEVADKIAEEGGHVIVKSESHFNILPGVIRFLKFLRSEHIDLVIAHTDCPIVWIYAILSSIFVRSITLKVYVHGDPKDFIPTNIKGKISNLLFQAACDRAREVICISKFVERETKKYIKNNDEKIHVMYNGITVEDFACEHNDSNNRCFQLIYVGRVFHSKGVWMFPEIMTKLPEKINLTVVGDGCDLPDIKKQAELLGVNNRICFLGNRLDVPELLSNADLFVHPAVWEEGFGITLAEALAAGVPCVAFHKGAIPELISENVNGWIAEEVSTDAIVKKILKAYDAFKKEDYSRYRKAARSSSLKFDITNLIDGLEKV